MKDTVEADEPEGEACFFQSVSSLLIWLHWTYYWLRITVSEVGDPLTAEEVEEKEQLLEEASEFTWFYSGLAFLMMTFV